MNDCNLQVKARELCGTHYYRWTKHGTTDLPSGRERANCTQDGCDSPAVGRQLCRKHYTRWQRTGDPEGLRRPPAPETVCAREGCNEPVKLNKKKRPPKYCSRGCFLEDGPVRWSCPRNCVHCSKEYKPTGPQQKYCQECAGEPIITERGPRWPGADRLRKYGVTALEWDAMVAKHDGKCWLCRSGPAECLDHCHESGIVRGALCRSCNRMLDHLDRTGWLANAQAYLAETKATVF